MELERHPLHDDDYCAGTYVGFGSTVHDRAVRTPQRRAWNGTVLVVYGTTGVIGKTSLRVTAVPDPQ
jgi:hypothetical protein